MIEHVSHLNAVLCAIEPVLGRLRLAVGGAPLRLCAVKRTSTYNPRMTARVILGVHSFLAYILE